MSGSWLVWLVHGAVVLATIGLALRDWLRLRRWAQSPWEQPPAKAETFGEAGAEEATRRLTGAEGPRTLVVALWGELERTRAPKHRVALLNEATYEFQSRLGFARVGSQGWRVCLASGVSWACVAVMEDVTMAAVYLGSGVVGGLLTWNLGRVADSLASGLRERWNGLIRRSRGSFPQSETFGDRPLTMQCGADEHG